MSRDSQAVATLRAAGYVELIAVLKEARPFVRVFTTDSIYTGVSSPKEVLARIDAALAAVKLCSKP